MSTYGKTKRLKMHDDVRKRKNKKVKRKMVITTGPVGQYKSLRISFMTKQIMKQAKR
jgi:hypothetical protein